MTAVPRSIWLTAACLLAGALVSAPAPAADAPAPLGRLIIPRLSLDQPLGRDLDSGPAVYPGSASPGEPYTIAIAGHRTTHTRPFWSLDLLRRGDRVVIARHGVRYAYEVTGSRVVAPTDWSIMRERGHELLVLTTCTPRFSARQRLVVFARAVHRKPA